MAQSQEQLAAARELATEYGLTAADFYQQRQSGTWLISRTGIERIQYKAGIIVTLDAVRAEVDYAAVKATATRGDLKVQTFGSAYKGNCRIDYYLEMAEKRALSRAVLKLTDFYKLGVYGEDEMPTVTPEPAAAAPVVSAPAPVSPEVPIMRAVPTESLTAPHTPEGDPMAASQPPVQYATASQKEEIIKLLNHPLITRQEKTKSLLAINRLDEPTATSAIARLRKAISDREANPEATTTE
jgi:hypothetical protein